MECRIERSIASQVVKVYLYEPDFIAGKTRVYQCVGQDEWKFEFVAENAPIEPTLTIHVRALEALVAAAKDIMPPSAATQKHLDDVIQVRDRLLSLVEKER